MISFAYLRQVILNALRCADAKMCRRTGSYSFQGQPIHLYRPYFWNYWNQDLLKEEMDPYFQLLETFPSAGTVVDAGPAVGAFSIVTGKLRPKINLLCIEPSRRQNILLRRNLQLNDLTKRAVVVNSALWNCQDSLTFRSLAEIGSLEATGHLPQNLVFAEKVMAETLDAICQRVLPQGEKVTLIKMDIEGAEIEALLGSKEILSRDRPVLYIQAYHLRKGTRTYEECEKFLQGLSYSVKEINPPSGFLLGLPQ